MRRTHRPSDIDTILDAAAKILDSLSELRDSVKENVDDIQKALRKLADAGGHLDGWIDVSQQVIAGLDDVAKLVAFPGVGGG